MSAEGSQIAEESFQSMKEEGKSGTKGPSLYKKKANKAKRSHNTNNRNKGKTIQKKKQLCNETRGRP